MLNSPNTRPVVLSADDDENAHFLLKRAFLKTGIKPALSLVNDGTEVLRYLLGEGAFSDRETYPLPDLLLLDLKMPKVSGFGVLEYIHARPQFQTFPIIVFSSSDDEGDVKKARALGCHSYVVKPGDFEKLLQLVVAIDAEFFGTRPTGEENRPPTPAFSLFAVPIRKVIPKEEIEDVNKRTPVPGSPEMFQFLVEQVKDYAIFMLDKEGYVLSWNEGARRIKGYEAWEIIGKHFSTFYPAPDLESQKPQFELKMAQEMGRYEEEGWRLRKDGTRFWANVVITPLRDANGKLSGFAKVTRDLTQRRMQEQHLQGLLESEERFRLLVEQVKDYAIFILDAKGNVASWNQGANHIKGYSSDEIIGRHFSVFYTPDALAKDHPSKELTIAIREGRTEDEGWRVRKDGSRFWASVVITSLWDKRGNLSGFAKVTRDLTDKKREEDALRQKTEELEAFAHTLSHDLRAPLRSIASFAQILKSDAKDLSEMEKETYLTKIAKAAQTMELLTRDILKLSQLSLAPASEELVSLDEIIDESLALLESEIKKTKAQIDVKKPLPHVKANRTLLLQIFSNLLANALKFVAAGQSPTVEVYCTRKDGVCEIHVKDTGIGVPEEFQQSVFKIFERGGAEGEFSGTGVGLAIVKRATERLGGSISVKSNPGEGSDFIVTLPCESSSPVKLVEAV